MSFTGRYLKSPIEHDALAAGKMAWISGPRQVGKTTLAKSLMESPENYGSWDNSAFRKLWATGADAWVEKRGPGPLVLDEIHKDRRWKTRLKGLFDHWGPQEGIVVTGSARLDIFKRGGDSLMGRYFPYRLHPFSVAEDVTPPGPDEIGNYTRARFQWNDLLALSGFPEPLLAGNHAKALRWSRLRRERLVREDVRDLRAISDLRALEVLTDLLATRAGGLLSINSLREDVGVAYATVRDWVGLLEALYFCILLRPYSGRLSRALKAEPKLYVFDPILIQPENKGAQLENLAALHLLKACQFWTDTAQGEFDLRYIRDKEKREVDFLVLRDRKPWMLVECKTTEKDPHPNLIHFSKMLGTKKNFQLVHQKGFDREYPALNTRVLDYEKFFSGWV